MASSKQPQALLGATAFKPVERHGWEAVRYFLHNPDTGEILSRTPMSWLLITVFYVIYYSCLAAFWAICMTIFLQTIPMDENGKYDQPKWQADNGIIGKSPGLGLRPKQSVERIDSAIIMFNKDSVSSDENEKKQKKVENWQDWVTRIDNFLDVYRDATTAEKGNLCTEKNGADNTLPCRFNLDVLEDCGKKETNYGYDKGSPCVFLKLNKIYGLVNENYVADKLPEEMPQDLKTHIKAQANKNQVWVYCQGKYPADKEMLKGGINYFPSAQGFPNYYFPYKRQMDYISPLVAVQFTPNKKAIGQMVHVECRAWAPNIGYSRRDKIGISVFEIQIMNGVVAKEINEAEE